MIRLIISDDIQDRMMATQDKRITVEMLCYMSNDVDRWVLHNVACNKKTPLTIIKKLSTNCDYLVKISVIQNPKTPNLLLFEMLNSMKVSYANLYATLQILSAIAHKDNITQEIIVKIYHKMPSSSFMVGTNTRNVKKIYSALLNNHLTPIDIKNEILLRM